MMVTREQLVIPYAFGFIIIHYASNLENVRG